MDFFDMISSVWKCLDLTLRLHSSLVQFGLNIIPAERWVQQFTNLHLDQPGSLEVPEDAFDPQDLQLRTSKKATVPGDSNR